MKQATICGGRAGQLLPKLYDEIRSLEQKGHEVLLLVPEQFTLQAERDLLQALQVPGLLRVRVLSPKRLLRLIHETGGRSPLPPLDSVGSSMAFSRALQLSADELSYYSRAVDRPGLPPKLTELIGELTDAGLTPAELSAAAEEAGTEATRAKLRDLACIWQRYLTVIQTRFADEAAQQADALQRLEQSGAAAGCRVFVYGFDRLSRAFCALLTELARLAEGCTVMLTMAAEDDRDARIFTLQRKCANRLQRIMEAQGIAVSREQLPDAQQEARHEMLRFMEHNLFARPQAKWNGSLSDALVLRACPNPTAENAFAAQTLLEWHRGGIPWERMAVACAGDAPASLQVALQQAGIPCYPAEKQSVLRHGLCRMLLGSLRAVSDGWRTADVLEAAGSGFSALTDTEYFRLENYVITNGIEGNKWLQPFTRGDEAAGIEPLRQRLIAPLGSLHDALIRARSGEASVEAIWRFLEDIGAYERLIALENRLLEAQEQIEAARTRQIWKVLLELLDHLRTLLGAPRCSLRDICRYVDAGLSSRTLSALPAVQGAVVIGRAGHMLTGELDALLFCGAQADDQGNEKQALITEREREALSAHAGHTVGTLQPEESALNAYRIYCTAALPLRHLTVSWAQASLKGEATLPASFVNDLTAMFDGLKPGGGVTATAVPDAPIPTLEALATRLRAFRDGHEPLPAPEMQAAAGWLWHHPRFGPLTQQISRNLNAVILPVKLSREQALRLFGENSVSISRLENYAGCPYRHFLENGLKPVERRGFSFEADDRGSFYHEVMQQLAEQTRDTDWTAAELAELDTLVDGIIERACAKWESGPLADDPLGRLTGEQYKRVVRHAAHLFAAQQRSSSFRFYGAELSFGYPDSPLPPLTLDLPGKHQLSLRGRIDRIDTCERTGETRVRIIDYKSSIHSVQMGEVLSGLQLQLLLYLKAAAHGFENGIPAGAFYFPVRDPMTTAADMSEDAVTEARGKVVQVDAEGWYLNEPDVMTDLGVAKKSSSHAMSRSVMEKALNDAEQTAVRIADDLRSGKADIDPMDGTCAFCRYARICRYDSLLAGKDKRQPVKVKNSDYVNEKDPAE